MTLLGFYSWNHTDITDSTSIGLLTRVFKRCQEESPSSSSLISDCLFWATQAKVLQKPKIGFCRWWLDSFYHAHDTTFSSLRQKEDSRENPRVRWSLIHGKHTHTSPLSKNWGSLTRLILKNWIQSLLLPMEDHSCWSTARQRQLV